MEYISQTELDKMLDNDYQEEEDHPIKFFIYRLPYRIKETRPIWKIRMFIQRGRKGYSVEDTWSFDNYLARVISGGCEVLKKNNHGWPAGFYGISNNEDPGIKEWEDILDRIANSFKNYNECEIGDTIEYDKMKMEFDEGMKLLCEVFSNLWD